MLRRGVIILWCLSSLLGLLAPAFGQPPEGLDTHQLENDLQAAMRDQDIAGLVVMLVEGDEIVYWGGLGVNAAGEPMDPTARYPIGRLAESLLTTLAMVKVEKGLFDPTMRMVNFVPNFALSSSDATPVLTPSRLMNHTAGLGGDSLKPLDALSFEVLRQVPVEFYPGSRFSYCVSCTAALVGLLQWLTGQPLDSLLEETIFYPLHMDQTRLEAGEIITTAPDLANFMSVHLQAGRWREVQLITPESIKTLHSGIVATARSDTEYYGYGWFVTPNAGLTVVEEEDDRLIAARDMGNYTAQMTLAPAYRRGILLLTDQPSKGLDKLMEIAVETFFGWTPPAFEPFRLPYYEGVFISQDPHLGGELSIEAVNDGVQVTYHSATSQALFLDQRTLVFEQEGRELRFYFERSSQAARAILSRDGVTAAFYRKG